MKSKVWIIIAAVVLVLLLIGFIYWKNKPLLNKAPNTTIPPVKDPAKVVTPVSVDQTGTGNTSGNG